MLKIDHAHAILILGCGYSEGSDGLPEDDARIVSRTAVAFQVAQFGNVDLYYNIGTVIVGRGVGKDARKVHYQLAAIGETSRGNAHFWQCRVLCRTSL